MLRELSKVEQRYDAVLAVIRDGMGVTEVAEKFGVHRDTVHSWLARYEADGLEGLRDRSHRPKTSPLQMPAVVEARVLELRRNRPHWGPIAMRSTCRVRRARPLLGFQTAPPERLAAGLPSSEFNLIGSSTAHRGPDLIPTTWSCEARLGARYRSVEPLGAQDCHPRISEAREGLL
jgi:transposase-like protein